MNRELILAKGEDTMATKYDENVGPADVLAPHNEALLLIDHQWG